MCIRDSTSASLHDSQVAIPLAQMTAGRIVSLYDLADAAYDAKEIREMSARLGHVALIDHNPRRGEKIEFSPAETRRYNERSAVERVNSHLHDEHGGRHVRVRLSAVPGTDRRSGQGGGAPGLRPAGHRRRADAQNARVAPPRGAGAAKRPDAKAGKDGVCSKTAISVASRVRTRRYAPAHAIFTRKTPRGDRRRRATRGVLQDAHINNGQY